MKGVMDVDKDNQLVVYGEGTTEYSAPIKDSHTPFIEFNNDLRVVDYLGQGSFGVVWLCE